MSMKRKILAAALVASTSLAFIPAYAAGDDDNPNFFVRMSKMAEQSSDGKVSKQQVTGVVEKADTRKEGKIDKKQDEIFWKMFTAPSGG